MTNWIKTYNNTRNNQELISAVIAQAEAIAARASRRQRRSPLPATGPPLESRGFAAADSSDRAAPPAEGVELRFSADGTTEDEEILECAAKIARHVRKAGTLPPGLRQPPPVGRQPPPPGVGQPLPEFLQQNPGPPPIKRLRSDISSCGSERSPQRSHRSSHPSSHRSCGSGRSPQRQRSVCSTESTSASKKVAGRGTRVPLIKGSRDRHRR